MSEPKYDRKYRVKEDWIFNLESMHGTLYCIKDDLEDENFLLRSQKPRLQILMTCIT